jgi:signal peptidase I
VAPDSAEGDLVKRVIGTGGDHVTCCDPQGRVRVNDQPLTEDYLFPGDKPGDAPIGCSGEFDVTVPEGYLWVMGDHRSVSSDSRCQDDLDRFVPEDLVRGRAVAVIWPLQHWDLLQKPDTFDAVS